MMFDPSPLPPYEELVKRGHIKPPPLPPVKDIDFFPNKYYRKPMKKTIPFDIEKAKNGAKVVTDTGREITIVSYNSKAIPGWPIIGRYTVGDIDHYELWQASGDYDEIDTLGREMPPKLLLEVEEAPKGYSVQGDAIVKDGNAIFAVLGPYSDTPGLGDKDALLNRIAAALNAYENKSEIFAIPYDHDADREIKYSKKGKEVLTLRNKVENLEAQVNEQSATIKKYESQIKTLQDTAWQKHKHYKDLEAEIAIYRKSPDYDLHRKINDLEQWKKEQLASVDRWREVSDYVALKMTIDEWGKPVQDVVLDRLKKHSEERALLIDRVNNLADQLEKYK